MTEYERLKEQIIVTVGEYTGDIKALTTRLMAIIADGCWLKAPDGQFMANGIDITVALKNAGWRPVKPVKEE